MENLSPLPDTVFLNARFNYQQVESVGIFHPIINLAVSRKWECIYFSKMWLFFDLVKQYQNISLKIKDSKSVLISSTVLGFVKLLLALFYYSLIKFSKHIWDNAAPW